MEKIVKQVAAIDVDQKLLVVTLGRMHDDWSPELYAQKTFANSKKGFESFLAWVKKNTVQEMAVRFVMEATGVYHEGLAYFLDDNNEEVTVVLPSKISNYMRTLEIKTITDKTASAAIAQFGLERKLELWSRPKRIYKQLRQLTRERDQLITERTVAKNQLHAEQAEAEPHKNSIARVKARIKMFDKQEKEVRAELSVLIATDVEMKKIVALLCSLPGVGLLTAVTVLGETNGFELIRNRRQLASYAGFDVKEKQSGTSVKGKPKISKKGNKYLRKAMHLPALAAIRHDERFKAVFVRIVSKSGIKMKAAVAVQRKLLEMMFTLYKTNKKYEKQYLINIENTALAESGHLAP
ncbi:MAG: IS110 family transposase [Chitinophagaceae bacterium]